MLLSAVIGYALVILLISFFAQRRIHNEEDFIVAGRRMSVWMNTGTLLATWFGAGTLLTSTDEIALEGVRIVALEPVGAGLCLVVTGLFFARPLWEMKICTLADFFKARFGTKAEVLQVLTSVPTFIGWIAVQLVALSGVFNVLFDWPVTQTIIGLGLFAMVYTIVGGMWSVSLTDALQAVVMIAGLALLGWYVLEDLSSAGGLQAMWAQSEAPRKIWIPTDRAQEFMEWFGWLTIAMLGNLPSQDLMQRVFAARSAKVAQTACLLAGCLYIVLGAIPVLAGMAFPALFPDKDPQAVVIQMAQHYFTDGMMVLFLLAVLSMVLSSMDSGILAPATILGRNVFRKWTPDSISSLTLCRLSVVLVSVACVAVALMGSRAFELLESCYSIGLAGLLIPLVMGLFWKAGNQTSALLAMIVGITAWIIEWVFGIEWPLAPLGAIAGLMVYIIHAKVCLKLP
jgi:SSS family solute:Na+ symporter